MTDISPDTIIAKFDATAGQWVAHFEQTPQVAFGGDLPVVAIRRILNGTEAAPGTYPVIIHLAVSSVLHQSVIWQPPEAKFPPSVCKRTGQPIEFLDIETCKGGFGGWKIAPG